MRTLIVTMVALFLGVAVCISGPKAVLLPEWAKEVFPIEHDGKILDTREFDAGGHAAPFLIDLDQDGRLDLVTGSILGQFRYFLNSGTSAVPKFSGLSGWLTAAGTPARVRNWCCMAAAPQFADVDGDGTRDLAAGTYGGPLYWFKGIGGTSFERSLQLVSRYGATILAHPETFWNESTPEGGKADSYAANIALTKWNDDSLWDMLLGNSLGELFVWRGAGDAGFGVTGPPTFSRMRVQSDRKRLNEILINGQKVLPEGQSHAAPAVADWDADGLWDILIGTQSGDVYFLRNSGSVGAPEFKNRTLLLRGGEGFQVQSRPLKPRLGIRTQIHIADYNSDGKQDLVVGCYTATITLRQNLSDAEQAQAAAILSRLEQLDIEVGNTHRELPSKFSGYYDPLNRSRVEEYDVLFQRLQPLLERHGATESDESGARSDVESHGNIWVFVRK